MISKVRARKSELLLPAFPDDDPAELLLPADNYTLLPFHESFTNFVEVVAPLLTEGHTYDVTAFYSKRKPLTVKEHESLNEYNQRAFAMAKHHGLTLYYQGRLDIFLREGDLRTPRGLTFVPDCLSFCIWESLGAAKAGAALPEHREAAHRVGDWYKEFTIKKFSLTLHTVTQDGVPYAELTVQDAALAPTAH